MNLDFVFLEMALWKLVCEYLDIKGQYKLLGADTIQLIVQQELQQNKDEYKVFLDYICEGTPGSNKRFVQICDRLSFFLLEYEYHRMEMVNDWLNGIFPEDPLHLGIAKLYLNIRLKLQETSHRSLFQISETLLNNSVKNTSKHKKCIHVFALSQISKFHIELIRKLQSFCDFHIYTINPCAEYWEDVQSPREKAWTQRTQPKLAVSSQELELGEIENNFENELVASLGKPGRENIKLLCDLTGYDFEDLYLFNYEEDKNSLLHQLQDGLLTLSQGTKNSTQDTSLQIFEAKSKMREFELIYASIVKNLQEDNTLALQDIAILVPNISDYQTIIINVFERQEHILSYNLADTSADQESLLAKGLSNFFQIIKEGLNRERLIKLLENSCIRAKFNIDDENLSEIFQYILDLGIFENDVKKLDKGTLNLRLKQLRLSKIMRVNNGFDQETIEFNNLTPIHQKSFNQSDTLSKFSLFTNHLFEAIQNFQYKQITITDLLDKLQFFVRDFFCLKENLSEESVYKELYNHILKAKVLEQDLKDQLKLNQETSYDYIESFLKGVASGRGNYLLGGVTIASLQPMRPMPYKIVYVAGLEEGSFPGVEIKSSLDLRLIKRKIGDVSLPERNRYLFLELLHCVREKLYLSYVGKNLKKDQDLEPSSVIQELVSCLNTYLSDDFLIQKTSLSSFLLVDNHAFSDLSKSYFTSDQAILAYQQNQVNYIKGLDVKNFKSINKDFSTSDKMITGMDSIISNDIKKLKTKSYTIKHLADFIKKPIETLSKLKFSIYENNDSYLELHSNLYPDYAIDFFSLYDGKTNYVNDLLTTNDDLNKQHNYHQYLSNIGKAPKQFLFDFINELKLKNLNHLSPKLKELGNLEFFNISIGEDSIINPNIKSIQLKELEIFDCSLKGSLPLVAYDESNITIVLPQYTKDIKEYSKVYPLLFIYALILHPECNFLKANQKIKLIYVLEDSIKSTTFDISDLDINKTFEDLFNEFFDDKSTHIHLNIADAIYSFKGSSKDNHIFLNENISTEQYQNNYSKYLESIDSSTITALLMKDNSNNLLHRAKKRFHSFYKEV